MISSYFVVYGTSRVMSLVICHSCHISAFLALPLLTHAPQERTACLVHIDAQAGALSLNSSRPMSILLISDLMHVQGEL